MESYTFHLPLNRNRPSYWWRIERSLRLVKGSPSRGESSSRWSPVILRGDMITGYSFGNWMANTRADHIGRNLPAMRAHDILRGVDLLAARSDVDRRGTADSRPDFAQ